MIVGYPGYTDMPLAWAITRFRRKPLVFDIFVSQYDTQVLDRQKVGRWSVHAVFYRLLDILSAWLADCVLIDTYAHGEYLHRLTGVPRRRVERVFIGADDEMIRPCPARPVGLGEPVSVLWCGSFMPMHGVEVIVEAASILRSEPIRFTIVGVNARSNKIDIAQMVNDLDLDNVELSEWVAYGTMLELICSADICLGAFGKTGKARRVIPTKVFEALASARPVITADTPAVRELLEAGVSVELCAPDGEALANSIRRLAADGVLRRDVGDAGRKVFEAQASLDTVGRRLDEVLVGVSRRRR